MEYLLTRKSISEAFFKSLGEEQKAIFESMTQNTFDKIPGLLIHILPFSCYNNMELHNSRQFFDYLILVSAKLTNEGNDLIFEIPDKVINPVYYLLSIFHQCKLKINPIWDKMSNLDKLDEEYLDTIYRGDDDPERWLYDWSDLVNFINTMDSYLTILYLNQKP